MYFIFNVLQNDPIGYIAKQKKYFIVIIIKIKQFVENEIFCRKNIYLPI